MDKLGKLPRGRVCYGWDNTRFRVIAHLSGKTVVLAGRRDRRLRVLAARTLVRAVPGRP